MSNADKMIAEIKEKMPVTELLAGLAEECSEEDEV